MLKMRQPTFIGGGELGFLIYYVKSPNTTHGSG